MRSCVIIHPLHLEFEPALCPLRIRACGEHGHLCRQHLRIGAAQDKRYLAPGTTGLVDHLFDDAADRLYCRRPRSLIPLNEPLPRAPRIHSTRARATVDL